MTIGDVPFTDDRLAPEKFGARKAAGSLPFGQLPLLSVDGTVMTQSSGILRYCGKVAGLYPRDDDVLALAIDEAIGVGDDIISNLYKDMGAGPEDLKAARQSFVENAVPRFMGGFEKIVQNRKSGSDSPYLCGNKLTVADLYFYVLIDTIKTGGVDHVPKTVADAYPALIAAYEAVRAHPKVVSWNEKHSQ